MIEMKRDVARIDLAALKSAAAAHGFLVNITSSLLWTFSSKPVVTRVDEVGNDIGINRIGQGVVDFERSLHLYVLRRLEPRRTRRLAAIARNRHILGERNMSFDILEAHVARPGFKNKPVPRSQFPVPLESAKRFR